MKNLKLTQGEVLFLKEALTWGKFFYDKASMDYRTGPLGEVKAYVEMLYLPRMRMYDKLQDKVGKLTKK